MDRGPLSTAEALRSLARRVGVRAPEIDSGLDWSIELLEALAERGANLVVHIDGERVRDRRFTVLLSGSLLDGDYIRREGSSAGATLAEVLQAFALEWPD